MPTRALELRSTTILAVRHRGRVVMGGDGQVTVGQTVLKHNARKIRRLEITAGAPRWQDRKGLWIAHRWRPVVWVKVRA